VTGRSKEGLESAQKELGNEALVVSSDARSLTDLDALASRLKAEFDTVDLLFVNAGFSTRGERRSQGSGLSVRVERGRRGARAM
jgi:NADP-dependent 3-hydroxy acid dehydrogenase YdfG